MSDDESKPVKLTEAPSGYSDWLGDIKTQIHEAQQRAAQALNLELVSLYWRIGKRGNGAPAAAQIGSGKSKRRW